MKSKFTKTLLMSSVIAMGAFGLTACGGEETPSGPKEGGDAEIILDETATSVTAGAIVKFVANISLAVDNPSIGQDADFAIDSLTFEVVDASNKKVNVQPTYTLPLFPTDKIALNSMMVTVNLSDPGFSNKCGDYNLAVKVFAHLTEGSKTSKKSATQLIPFTRSSEVFCAAIESSSGGGAVVSSEIEMVTYTAAMSTADKMGLDLATGTVSASTTADIVLTKTSGGVILSSGNGTLFSTITNDTDSNYDDDYDVTMWPEEENGRNAYVSDFRFKNITKTQLPIVESGSPAIEIFVALTPNGDAKTGTGFYAFAAVAAAEGLNRDFDVTLKVYKKK